MKTLALPLLCWCLCLAPPSSRAQQLPITEIPDNYLLEPDSGDENSILVKTCHPQSVADCRVLAKVDGGELELFLERWETLGKVVLW